MRRQWSASSRPCARGMACRAGPGPAVLRDDRRAHRRRVERTSRPTSERWGEMLHGQIPGTESVQISCVPPASGSTGCRTGRPRPFRSPSIASLSEAVRRHRRLGRSKGGRPSRIQRSSRSSATATDWTPRPACSSTMLRPTSARPGRPVSRKPSTSRRPRTSGGIARDRRPHLIDVSTAPGAISRASERSRRPSRPA
jgi:hypothetical protein